MTQSTTTVFIRDLELLARIGVHGHEHGKPQPVRINVWLTCNVEVRSDKLDSAVDYEKVADTIRGIIAADHINLAETLAERIAASCLKDKRVQHVRVRVEKLHALAGTDAAGVEIERASGK
jgi:7,8-dihydroneopterin aldolase/epimerase/oxygenase